MFTLDTDSGKRYGRFRTEEDAIKFLLEKKYIKVTTLWVRPTRGSVNFRVAKIVPLSGGPKPLKRSLLK